MRHLLTCLIVLALAPFAFAAEKRTAAAPPPEDPSLPRVFIIGDSISMGYTPFVQQMLKGKANVRRPKDNCASTVVGLQKLDAWLGKDKWDVIHFNWGLHDMKYVGDAKGTLVDVAKGKQWVPIDQYEKNLRELVERLKKTGAKLVWCSTTPVPAGATGRVKGDELRYNEVAAKIMKENGIAIDDLCAVAAAEPKLQRPANVHFTDEGSKALAKAVAESIEKALATK